VDYLGSVFTSTNGAYWSRVRDKDGSEMWSAGFGDGIFVAGGNGMLLEAGTDMSWVRVPTPLVEGAWPAEISGITYANGHFIGVGFLNLIVRGTVVPAPSRLSSPRANRDGTFEFFAQVKPNETYRIEVSEDLRSWSFVTNVTSQTTSSPLKFATPDKSRSIFYRVVHE
jgi:hypothetical protein